MTQTYSYKQPKDDWFWLSASGLFVLITIYILTRIVITPLFNVFALLLPITFGVIGTLLFRVYLIRQGYYKIDKDKTLIIDPIKRQVLIKQPGKQTIINSEDIKDIEIYESWNNNPLFSSLGYVKFNLSNGDSIKVTKFTADNTDLQPLMTGKTVKRKTKLMNKIN